mgnify:FL=1
MTLANCKRLLEHYEKLSDGTIEAPEGHKDWHQVVERAKINAEEMKARIERKLKNTKYANEPKEDKETKSKGKK